MKCKLLLTVMPVLVLAFSSCNKSAPAKEVLNPPDSTGSGNGGAGGSDETPAPDINNTDAFLYGSNMGYYGSDWTDEKLSEILIGSSNTKGVGVNSLRPAMYDYFVQQWGYNIRVSAFQYYQQLGAKNNVIFLNGPSDAHMDKTIYCTGHQSQTFANLYEPIWTGNGQINTNNYYANYVYNVVKTYGPYVKYWEVWNEPDYTSNWNASQTWAQTNPDPCDLTGFYAPIQSYVRMLRITYEIVKKLDAGDQVCLGGIGYESFLDAILRNTDNPNGGAVTSDYPSKGGQWFDCVSFHIYPMYYLGNNKNSDAAAQTIADRKSALEAVLAKYQYNGKKSYIITECNIPRKSINNYIGSTEAQRNFMIKAAVTSQKSGISGLYIYGPAESEAYDAATDPYQVMGFYQKITSGPYNVTINESGTSWRTTSKLLKDRFYDKNRTDALQLPSNVEGAAFYSAADKNYIYVLWAKAAGSSENASATYSFPTALGISNATQYSWDEKTTQTGKSIGLTGAPVFIKP